jgi:glycine C-acetyltransferase
VAEVQGCPAQIDVLLGDLSVTSGVAGGFAAFRDPALASRLIRTGAMQPHSDDSAAMILAVLDLIASAEGRRRRRRLQATSLRLRNHLMGDRLPVMGQPSPVVPLRLPKEMAKAMASMAALAGLRLPLVGPPDVPGCAPRWLIRLSAGHGPADIDDLAATLHDVIRACARQTLVSAP